MGTNEKWRRSNQKQVVILLALGIALFLGVQWYYGWREEAALLRVIFANPDGSNSSLLKMEIASTCGERQKGLMFRKSLLPHRGMIFVFPETAVQSFWMKDTYIPLDMVFVDQSFKVVGLLENVPILNEEKRRVQEPSLYVVELAAGEAAGNGITTGSELQPQGPLPRGVPCYGR